MKQTGEQKMLSTIEDIYVRLYAESTPPADWNKLKESGEAYQERFFMKYELPVETMDRIIEEETKKHRFYPFQKQMIKNTVYLGSSPKSKI